MRAENLYHSYLVKSGEKEVKISIDYENNTIEIESNLDSNDKFVLCCYKKAQEKLKYNRYKNMFDGI